MFDISTHPVTTFYFTVWNFKLKNCKLWEHNSTIRHHTHLWIIILGPLDNDICITVQACSEPKDLIRACVMPAPIGFCVAMLGGIFLCHLAGRKHRCLCAGLCHPPTQLEKVQRTHHCISEVWNPKVEASLLTRGESRKGIPNIWITLERK